MQSDDRPTDVTLGDRHNACHARFTPPAQYVSRCEFDPQSSILFSATRTKPADGPRSKPYAGATARIRVGFAKHKDDIRGPVLERVCRCLSDICSAASPETRQQTNGIGRTKPHCVYTSKVSAVTLTARHAIHVEVVIGAASVRISSSLLARRKCKPIIDSRPRVDL